MGQGTIGSRAQCLLLELAGPSLEDPSTSQPSITVTKYVG